MGFTKCLITRITNKKLSDTISQIKNKTKQKVKNTIAFTLQTMMYSLVMYKAFTNDIPKVK